MRFGKNKLPIWLSVVCTISLVCFATVGGAGAAAGETNSAAATTSSGDENQLRQQAAAYEKDFAKGDAEAIAAMCTADCDYIDADGNEYKGRDEIERTYSEFFSHGGAKPIKVTITSIAFPTPDVAVEQGITSSNDKSAGTNANKYMVVHVKRDGKWLMYRVTETYSPRIAAASKLKELGWLIGSWTATGSNRTLHLSVKYTGDDHFINCSYAPDGTSSNNIQVITWDPRAEQIISWHFGADGGFGQGLWRETPSGWINRAFTIEADGSRGSATYVLQKLDNNSFLWHSTQRSLNGSPLPDTESVKVTRDEHQG
jgi:uncharacterized protein (TIGR02246 family)